MVISRGKAESTLLFEIALLTQDISRERNVGELLCVKQQQIRRHAAEILREQSDFEQQRRFGSTSRQLSGRNRFLDRIEGELGGSNFAIER